MRTRAAAILLLLGALAVVASAADKVDPAPAFNDPAASAAVKQALEDKGYTVTVADKPLLQIWLRKGVPAADKPAAEGLFYSQLTPGELIGVATFPAETRDFRNQRVKPGTYTMRYELIPADGDHLGVSPNRDFVLLSPIAADTDPNAVYKFDDMVALSKQSTGTKHPQPFCLIDPQSGGPKVTRDEANDYVIFSTSLSLAGGKTIPISFIVKGQAQQ